MAARGPARSIRRAEAAAALARLAKAEPRPQPAAERSPTSSGRFRPPGRAKTAVPGNLSIPTFADDAERRGLAFTFDNGRSDLYQLPETMSGGVAVLDFDGDGWLDIYAVQGGPFPPAGSPSASATASSATAATAGSRTSPLRPAWPALPGGYGHGVAVGDFDNDGRPDLFVTRWRSYALYHNLGDGRFEDVDRRARASAATATGRPRRHGPTWTTTATSTSMSATT